MSDPYLLWSISLGATIAQGIFWYWVNSLKNNSQENTKNIDSINSKLNDFKLQVTEQYQSKADAHRDMNLIMETLKEIKVEVKEVSNKLDKKADKP